MQPTQKDLAMYYGNWSTYGANVQPQDINWSSITKGMYSFAMVGNSIPQPDSVKAEWELYEKTFKYGAQTGGLTAADINDLKSLWYLQPKVLYSGKNDKGEDVYALYKLANYNPVKNPDGTDFSVYPKLTANRSGSEIKVSINDLKVGDKTIPKVPEKLPTNLGVLELSEFEQLQDFEKTSNIKAEGIVKPSGYATGKYSPEIFSTDPWSDFKLIDCQKYYNCVPDAQQWGFGKNNIANFIKSAHDAGKKAILSIGGWSSSVALLHAMKTSPDALAEAITKFITETVPKACNLGADAYFDGVDIDLEPYENDWSRMSSDEVDSAISAMIAIKTYLKRAEDTIKATTGKDHKLPLDFTIGASTKVAEKLKAGKNFDKLKLDIDKFNIMTYDYHGTFDGPASGTNFHTALYAGSNPKVKTLSIDESMKAFSEIIPKEKLCFGVAAYGRAYKLYKPEEFDPSKAPKVFDSSKFDTYKPSDFLYVPFKNETGPIPLYSANSHIADAVGNLGYNEQIIVNNRTHVERPYIKDATLLADEQVYNKGYSIREMIAKGDMKEELVLNSDGKVIGACGLHKNGYFLTYDTPATTEAKVKYLVDNGHGGLIFWSASGDYCYRKDTNKSQEKVDCDKNNLAKAASAAIAESISPVQPPINPTIDPNNNAADVPVSPANTDVDDMFKLGLSLGCQGDCNMSLSLKFG